MESFASRLPPELRVRAESDADESWLAELFIETRMAEFAAAGWPPAEIRSLLRDQFLRQREHYRKVYNGAEYLVVEHGDMPIGRMYMRAAEREIRVMDIALLATHRGRGFGTALILAVIEMARSRDCEVTLHVEPGNPAQRLYRRLGFHLIEQRGIYDFLGWRAAPNPAG